MADTPQEKPTSQTHRIVSLLRTGPRALILRFYDQTLRKRTGHPVWNLSRVLPQLYVGGQHSSAGWQKMQDAGVTAIVNMREAHLDDAEKGIAGTHYLHLPTRDNTPPTLESLRQAAEFITAEIEAGGTVYVHCGVGVGRAPSAAAAYLISTGMTAKQAIAAIKRVRPFIHLTGRQFKQLVMFEQSLKDAPPQ